MKKTISAFFGNETGTVAVYVALALVVLLSCGALALDIAHMVSVKRELTKAAQAGALAGARGLWPQTLWATSGTRDVDWDRAQTWALNAATSNKAEGANLATSEVTVEIGRWDYSTKQFIPGNTSDANGARVTTQKTNVRMFFAQIFGIFSKNMSSTAIALMDFIGSVGQGTIPIVLNKDYTDVGTVITIYAGVATSDNGGWFTVPPDSTAASTLRDYIRDDSCPALWTGETVNLQNGQDSSFLNALQTKLNQQTSSPKYLDCILPVVDTNSFNQDGNIIGFVPFRITDVKDTGSNKMVTGTVLTLGELQNSLPGGSKFGALAPPRLAQ